MERVKPDFEAAREYYSKLPRWAKGEVSTTVERLAFIMGLVRQFKPRTIVEIGVSAGTLSGAILQQGVGYSDDVLLYGVDLGEWCYFDPSRPIGEVVHSAYLHLGRHFDLYTGKTALDIDEIVSRPVDFVYIDANHSHPWATIDCLCVLPHLSDDAIVAFHDTRFSVDIPRAGLFTYISLDVSKLENFEEDVRGTGVCFIRKKDIPRVLDSLLLSMSLPWETTLGVDVVNRLLSMVEKHWGEEVARCFEKVVRFLDDKGGAVLAQNDAQRRAIASKICNSFSWKITAPIRWCRRLLGQVLPPCAGIEMVGL